MRLKKAQKEALLSWIAEGLTSDEINERAAEFDPVFEVSRQQVDWYRKSRGVEIEELISQGEYKALETGLAKKSKRVELLKKLAIHMADDLFKRDKFWTKMVKGIGRGEDFQVINYKEFNTGEVAQLRGVLDDIAKELGDRKGTIDLTSGGKTIRVSLIDPDNEQ